MKYYLNKKGELQVGRKWWQMFADLTPVNGLELHVVAIAYGDDSDCLYNINLWLTRADNQHGSLSMRMERMHGLDHEDMIYEVDRLERKYDLVAEYV